MTDKPLKDSDIEKRRDDALRRALQTPPKPKQESEKGKEKMRPGKLDRQKDR
jgi:hypothetical protein